MAASVEAAAAAPPPPPAVEEADGGDAEQARTLIGALNLLSRNLPLPPAVLRAVSSIYRGGDEEEDEDEDEEEPDVVGDGGEPESRAGEVCVDASAVCGDLVGCSRSSIGWC
ncbi:hypothetical protein QYE76_009478 [Lolium multiflorum]|uniref:Uncharacterized protein n=1 Tax=Lolium multiflorum TaxID=4521 RepID=A0AAD8TS03_LOLMU|nr:hypothetical protein QYE76_009478 [Lolium multiflorum]